MWWWCQSSRVCDSVSPACCMQINIGGGHQLETRASEPEAAVPKIAAAAAAAAAAADSPVDMQSASSADDSEPELQELPKQSSPNKRRRITDLQPDNSKHDDSEVDTDPDSQGAPSPVVLQGTAHAQRPDDRHGSGNVSSDDDDDVDEDDDDLLVVKRRDVLSDSNAAAAAEGGIPLGGVELRGNKKRKKLRIDPGKTSGARTVFDEAGESLQPLALLAKEELDRSAHLLPINQTASLQDTSGESTDNGWENHERAKFASYSSFNAVQEETDLGPNKVPPYTCLVQSHCPCVSACCSGHVKSADGFRNFSFSGVWLLRANCKQRCLANAWDAHASCCTGPLLANSNISPV